MAITYSTIIAMRFGINTALVAAYLYQEMGPRGFEVHKRRWVRCARKTLTAVYPFLGVCAVGNALKRLTKNGILLKHEYNDSRFDRTLSFSFTDFGIAMMEEKQNG